METATGITTNDISEFMSSLGFKWSNEAQVYYCDQFTSKVNEWHTINGETAKHLYIMVVKPNEMKG